MNRSDTIPFELQLSLHSVDSNETFLNMVSYYMPLKLSEKMMLLSCGDFKRRAFELLQILNREIQYANLRLDIQNRTQHVISDEQKQYFLRQQLKSINKELGQQEGEPEKTKLKEQARNKHWSDKVKETFEKELSRLDQMHPQSADYNTQLTYLQQILDLPWEEYTKDNLDLKRAERTLNKNHYGIS